MDQDDPPAPGDIPLEDISAAGRGVVFVLDTRVCLEVPELGRLEFPPDVAEKVARALMQGAALLRKQGPQHRLVKLLD